MHVGGFTNIDLSPRRSRHRQGGPHTSQMKNSPYGIAEKYATASVTTWDDDGENTGDDKIRRLVATFDRPVYVKYLQYTPSEDILYWPNNHACLYLDDEKVACTVDVSRI